MGKGATCSSPDIEPTLVQVGENFVNPRHLSMNIMARDKVLYDSMTLKQLAGRPARAGGPVTGRASMNPRGVGPAFTTHVVDVEVDAETGKVDILRYTAAQDVGKAVSHKASAGRLTKSTSTTRTARCGTPASSTTACRRVWIFQ